VSVRRNDGHNIPSSSHRGVSRGRVVRDCIPAKPLGSVNHHQDGSPLMPSRNHPKERYADHPLIPRSVSKSAQQYYRPSFPDDSPTHSTPFKEKPGLFQVVLSPPGRDENNFSFEEEYENWESTKPSSTRFERKRSKSVGPVIGRCVSGPISSISESVEFFSYSRN
jgi:hypothetical protein